MSSNLWKVDHLPTSTNANTGTLTGGATAHQCLNDSSDASYITFAAFQSCDVSFNNAPASTDSYAYSLQVAVRLSGAVGTRVSIYIEDSTASFVGGSYVTLTSTAPTWYYTTVWYALRNNYAVNAFQGKATVPLIISYLTTPRVIIGGATSGGGVAATAVAYAVQVTSMYGIVPTPSLQQAMDPQRYVVRSPHARGTVRPGNPPLEGSSLPPMYRGGLLRYTGTISSSPMGGRVEVLNTQLPDVYHMKIFSVAVMRSNSFDPWATVADVWDSDVQPFIGTTLMHVVETPIRLDSIYPTGAVVFTRFGDSLRNGLGGYQWGTWQDNGGAATSLMTAGYTTRTLPSTKGPITPKLTVTSEPGNFRVKLDVQGYDNLLAFDATHNVGRLQLTAGANTTIDSPGYGVGPIDPWESWTDLRFTRTTAIGDAVGTYPKSGYIPITAGKTYAFATYAYAAATLRNVTVAVSWYNAAAGLISTVNIASLNDAVGAWTLVSGTLVAPANTVGAKIAITFTGCAVGEIHYTGDWIFRIYDAVSSPAVGTMCSAGYHGGSWLGRTAWTQNASGAGVSGATATVRAGSTLGSGYNLTITPASTAAPRNSPQHYLVTRTAASTAFASPDTFDIDDMLGGTVPKYPTTVPVTVSAWVRSSAGSIPGAAIGIEFYDKWNVLIPDYSFMGTPLANTTTTYQMVSCTGTIPTNASYFKIVCSCGRGANAQVYYWTDYTLVVDDAAPIDFLWGGYGYDYNGTYNSIEHPGALYVIERKVGSSGDWVPILVGAYDFYTEAATAYDYVVPYGVNVYYRAYTMGFSLGDPVQSAYTAEAAVTESAAAETRWMLFDTSLTTGPFRFDMNAETQLAITRRQDTAIFQPLGRSKSLVTTDQLRGKSFSLAPIDSLTTADLDTIASWISVGRQLWLVRPWTGEWWSVRLTNDMSWIEENTSPTRYLVTVRAEEVDVPSVL